MSDADALRLAIVENIQRENLNPIEEAQAYRRLISEFSVSQADVDSGKISFKSPLGKALIGRHEGDEAVVPAPSGQQNWEIVEVRYR